MCYYDIFVIPVVIERRFVFIVFDGVDRAGKTTQMDLMAQYCLNSNIKFCKTREPGGTLVAESVREIFMNYEMPQLTQLFLVFAARNEHLQFLQKNNSNSLILCDRFLDSTYAYQNEIACEVIDYFAQLCKCPEPDLVFLFLHRYNGESLNHMDEIALQKSDLIKRKFQERANKTPEKYCVLPNLPEQELHQVIKEKILKILNVCL